MSLNAMVRLGEAVPHHGCKGVSFKGREILYTHCFYTPTPTRIIVMEIRESTHPIP